MENREYLSEAVVHNLKIEIKQLKELKRELTVIIKDIEITRKIAKELRDKEKQNG